MILIGLCGAAGCGKGSAAYRLVNAHGFREMAFADPLYAAVAAITGKTADWLKDRVHKERPLHWCGGKSPRELLQLLGTEFGREMIHTDIWVMRAMRAVREAESEGAAGVVITDVRFDNEAAAIRAEGGFIVEVVRPGDGCLSDTTAKHASEAGISREHILASIGNYGTLDDLAASVDAVIESLHADIL